MDSEAFSRKLSAVVDRPSRPKSNRRMGWRSGLAIAAAIAALAIAFGVAVDRRWLSLAALAPLLFTLPCAVMMLMCMRGMKHGSNAETRPSALNGQDDQDLALTERSAALAARPTQVNGGAMRTIITTLAAAALIATASTPAFAHHKLSHSIAMRSAGEGHASAQCSGGTRQRAIRLATGRRGAPATHQRAHEMPDATHDGAGVVTAMAANQVTLRHEPIASLGWPAMTMCFRAQSTDLLAGLSVGDHVRFRVQSTGNGFVIDQIVKQ